LIFLISSRSLAEPPSSFRDWKLSLDSNS
jgi:hypothetical protein